ncbi:MAG TPA: PAS domain-containing protein, partial [Ramlibacter sp.]
GRPKDRSPLYFGLFCLLFALVMGLTGTRVLQPLFAPLGWDRYLQLVFLCWYGVNVLFTLFVRSLYPQQVSERAVRVIVAWGALSLLMVLVSNSRIYTQLMPTLAVGAGLTGFYLGWRLFVAARAGRRTAPLLLAGLVALVVAVTHDALRYEQLTRYTLLPYGVLLFVAAPAYLMARRFARALLVEERMAIEQRERADLLVRSTKAGLLDWDAISGRVDWSERLREMLGYPAGPEQPEMPAFRELLHPDDHDRVQESFHRQLRDREVRSGVRVNEPMDYRLRRTDGDWLWIHAEAVSVCDARGRTLRYICSFIDISDRVRHEAEMSAQVELTRTEQRRLDLVVRGARVGMVDWDGITHETYYSPRFREIRGYAPDADTTDWPDYFRVMIHPEERERVTRRWVTFIKGHGPEGPHGEFYSPEEYRLSRADGDYVWVQVSGMAVRDERGFVVRWIAAIIDITERRAQQQALRASHDQIAAQAALLEQQNETLKENVRLREEVERIGRHDIKTPLNSIVSVPRLLREERRLGPEADELLGIVERAGYRILSMVNLSLDLYKMEQGSYIFRPDAVDLADLVDKVLADVRMHAASKGIRFDVDLKGAAYAWAEELLCYSLLANLVKNAVEASPEGQAVSIRAGAAVDGGVTLHIHNHGEVPPAIRGSFFQKYATLGKASGTGLGTYSAQLMARVQDGAIAMATGPEGTTLSVTLRAAAEGVTPATVRHANERARGDRLQVAALSPRRVLLVDDDEYNLLIVRRFLPTPPFTVDTAINGRVALAAAQRHWPDVLFMDLDMPVMGGMEAVRQLRVIEQAQASRCTMIALSSHEDPETQAAALAAGFDHYLTKPVTRELIYETLLGMQPVQSASALAPASPADPVLVDVDMEAGLADYLASRRALVAALAPALRSGDRQQLRRLAHQLAGSLALYGFRWAGDQCRWIEHEHATIELPLLATMV